MRVTKRNWTISIIYFIVVIFTLLLRISFALGLSEYIPIDSSYLFTIVVQIFIFGLFPFLMYILSQDSFSDGTLKPIKSMAWRFGFTKKVSLRNWLRTIAITFLMIFSATFISWIWNAILSMLGFVQASAQTEYTNIGVLFMQLLMVALLPACFEEFTHRGLIFAGFRSNNLKDGWKLILLSALFFSLMHQNIRQTGYTFYDGIIMGMLCYYTGSIYPSIFAHFINNAGSVFSEYSQQNGGFYIYINKVYDWFMSSIWGFATFMLCVIVAISLLVLLLYRMRKDFVKEQVDIRIKRAVDDGTIPVQNVENLSKSIDKDLKLNAISKENDISLNKIYGDKVQINNIENLKNNSENFVQEKLNNYENNSQEKSNNNEQDIDDNLNNCAIQKSNMFPIVQTTLPDDFSKDFEEPDRKRKAVFVYVILSIGLVCAILSFVWGMLR